MLARAAACTFSRRSVEAATTARRALAALPAPEDELDASLEAGLAAMRDAGTFKTETQMLGAQGPVVGELGSGERVRSSAPRSPRASLPTPSLLSAAVAGDKHVLNFCANNYLGLSNHPSLVSAAHAALDTHGFGLSSVRFICGTQDIHKQLEKRLAAFHGQEDAILYPSCFDANAGLFEAILTKDDAIISDELNHASIIDGVRLCKAGRHRYAHADMKDLDRKLADADAAGARVKLVATDGVFSMDGTVAPLPEIVATARKHGALVFIDECHATGVIGATLRGTDEYYGMHGAPDIVNSTLGKALGGATGGYTAASAAVVATLRQKARPYLFSNSVAPAVVAASLAALDLVERSPELGDALRSNTARFRGAMRSAGFTIGAGDHPIVPVMLGDARLATAMAASMLDRGIYVVGFSYPVVPKGKARIRVQLSAAHTAEQVDEAVAAFVAVGRELGVVE